MIINRLMEHPVGSVCCLNDGDSGVMFLNWSEGPARSSLRVVSRTLLASITVRSPRSIMWGRGAGWAWSGAGAVSVPVRAPAQSARRRRWHARAAQCRAALGEDESRRRRPAIIEHNIATAPRRGQCCTHHGDGTMARRPPVRVPPLPAPTRTRPPGNHNRDIWRERHQMARDRPGPGHREPGICSGRAPDPGGGGARGNMFTARQLGITRNIAGAGPSGTGWVLTGRSRPHTTEEADLSRRAGRKSRGLLISGSRIQSRIRRI